MSDMRKMISVLAATSALSFISFLEINAIAFGQPSSDQYSATVLNVDGNQYVIRFKINGEGSIQNINVDKNSKSLVVMLAPNHGNGTLSMQLTRNIIDARDENKADTNYIASVDGTPQTPRELEKSDTARTISVSFPKDARQIMISGTYVVPEFETIAAFAAVTAGMIAVLTIKKSGGPKGM